MHTESLDYNEFDLDASAEQDIPYVVMLFMTLGWVVWMVAFDNAVGNHFLRDDQLVIDAKDGYQIVKSTDVVLPREKIEELEHERDKQTQRADDAERFAIAMGVKQFNGAPVGVILIVDLVMAPDQRELVKRYARHMEAEKFVLLACGDKVEMTGRKLQIVNDATAKVVAEKLDQWPRASERRLLDAIEGALSIDGTTRIVLCLAGPPTGGTIETIKYLKRRRFQVPINCLDYSTDGAVEVFLREVSSITGGQYQKGR